MLKSGIYAIYINKKWYIGSAIDLIQRKRRHKHRLNTNKHPNKHLQAAYNKYQEFEFIILEYCEKDVLLKQEEFWISWIDATDPSKGYNKRKIPNSNLGLSWSEDTRKKMSLVQKGHKRNLGRACTEEAKIKLSIAHIGKPKPHFRNYKDWPHPDGENVNVMNVKKRKIKKNV